MLSPKPGTKVDKKTPRLRSGPLVERPDGELVTQAIAGDTEAYGELVNRYQHEVRNLARAIVKDFQNAEDLAQDAFIKAFHSLSDLKEPEKFGGWICTILRHTCLDFLRSGKHNVSLEVLQEEGFEPSQEESERGVAKLESHEEEARTLEALINLREDYREIIILKHVEKMSYKDIAKRLNMSVSAVGEKLSRVRALLKRRLEKQQIKPLRGDAEGE
ncbi:MAG TPA: RNA polymerase sigma factor [Planctomycetota bacterium]|nr:RNA polymerase sigma factor [Planctomycetota bacterium]